MSHTRTVMGTERTWLANSHPTPKPYRRVHTQKASICLHVHSSTLPASAAIAASGNLAAQAPHLTQYHRCQFTAITVILANAQRMIAAHLPAPRRVITSTHPQESILPPPVHTRCFTLHRLHRHTFCSGTLVTIPLHRSPSASARL